MRFRVRDDLGGNTIPRLLEEAARQGLAVRIRFVGLASPELHIDRVAARVAEGGHDIPAAKIRERYDRSRSNLIQLLPYLTELEVFDNSIEANPLSAVPHPRLLLHYENKCVLFPPDAAPTLDWVSDIVGEAFRIQGVGTSGH